MIERVERLPKPDPNIDNLLAVLRREKPERVPFLELKLDDEVMGDLLGEPFVKWDRNDPAERREHAIAQITSLMHRIGFDAFRLRTGIPFDAVRDKASDTAGTTRESREWQNEHSGPIQSREDFERFHWPTIEEVDFGPVEEIQKALPDGMACIAYCAGVFEWSSWLMGLENFMLALYEQPDLARDVVDRVGSTICQCFEVWCKTDGIPILWLGDDLGFKTSTMIRPEHIREYILPWHRKCVELAHQHNKPFMLHCCGNIKPILPDLIDDIGIDAKHSYEDVIQPVEAFMDEWAGKVAVVGGVDIDVLARRSEEDVVRRTQEILEACAPHGGYCAGSGNSVPNYVPTNNFLAMIETVHRFNGRM